MPVFAVESLSRLNPTCAEIYAKHCQAKRCNQSNTAKEDNRRKRLILGFANRGNRDNSVHRKIGHYKTPVSKHFSKMEVVGQQCLEAVAWHRQRAAMIIKLENL